MLAAANRTNAFAYSGLAQLHHNSHRFAVKAMRSRCRLEDAETILDEAIPELTGLRARNLQLEQQVRCADEAHKHSQ